MKKLDYNQVWHNNSKNIVVFIKNWDWLWHRGSSTRAHPVGSPNAFFFDICKGSILVFGCAIVDMEMQNLGIKRDYVLYYNILAPWSTNVNTLVSKQQ